MAPARNSIIFLAFASSLLISPIHCDNGWLGWVFTSDNPKEPQSEPAGYVTNSNMDLESVEARFEIQRQDAFLNEVEKYAGLKMSELDKCQHAIIFNLKTACSEMSEEQIAKMGVQLLNCQSRVEGRMEYPCTSSMTLKQCTYEMDANAWNAYHLMSNRARAVCYAARQQQFAVRTEMTVNKLAQSAHEHVLNLNQIKEKQDELGSLTSATLNEVARGQEALAAKQTQLKETQKSIQGFVSENLRELSKEKILIAAVQSELDSMGKALRRSLEDAAEQLKEFESSRRMGHEKIVEDLKEINEKTKSAWSKVDEMTAKVLTIHGQTLESLSRINSSIAFLQNFMGNLDVQLNEKLMWLNSTLNVFQGYEMAKLDDLILYVSHVTYLLVAALCASFLKFPMFSRIFILFCVPLNTVTADMAVDFPTLTVIIMTFLGGELSLRYWLQHAKRPRGLGSVSRFLPNSLRNLPTPVATVVPVSSRVARMAGGRDIGALSDGEDDCGAGGRHSPEVSQDTDDEGEVVRGNGQGLEQGRLGGVFPPFCSTPRTDAPAGDLAPPPLSRVAVAPSTSAGQQRAPPALDVRAAKRSLLNRLLMDSAERRAQTDRRPRRSDEEEDAHGDGEGGRDEDDEDRRSSHERRSGSHFSGTSSNLTPSRGGRSSRASAICAGVNRRGENCRNRAVRGSTFCAVHQR